MFIFSFVFAGYLETCPIGPLCQTHTLSTFIFGKDFFFMRNQSSKLYIFFSIINTVCLIFTKYICLWCKTKYIFFVMYLSSRYNLWGRCWKASRPLCQALKVNVQVGFKIYLYLLSNKIYLSSQVFTKGALRSSSTTVPSFDIFLYLSCHLSSCNVWIYFDILSCDFSFHEAGAAQQVDHLAKLLYLNIFVLSSFKLWYSNTCWCIVSFYEAGAAQQVDHLAKLSPSTFWTPSYTAEEW